MSTILVPIVFFESENLPDENGHGELLNRTTTPKLVGSSIIPPLKKRRKRTNLDNAQRAALTLYFDENCRPDHNKMVEIAEALDLDPDVVRVWFCNRRQKLRKNADSSDPEGVEMDNINVSPAGMDAFIDSAEPT